MSRYSPIAPIHLLEQLHKDELLGNYLLLLAHDVLKEPIRYENLILDIRDFENDKDDTFIIMDNSVVELGSAMSATDVIEAASVVEANCIMTPDSLGGFDATVALIEDQAEELINSQFPLMRVPQGKDLAEIKECIDWIHEYLPVQEGKPEYWGIPRWISNELGSRMDVLCYIAATIPNAQIHLLGMSNHYHDDRTCALHPQVMGIDSANPVVMGMHGLDMATTIWVHAPRGNLWWELTLTREVVLNVEMMHNVIAT